MGNLITGIDIGGTHITACVIDVETGTMINDCLFRTPVDASLDHEKILSSWADAIQHTHKKAGILIPRIGIAMPGPFDYENGISYISGLNKYENLYGLNVKMLLAQALGIPYENIRFMNDASAYLLGEMHLGSAKGYSHVVGITLGTGLGSAVFHENRLHDGDLYCTEFLDGKCEDFASAIWIISEYEKLSGIKAANVKEVSDRCDDDPHAAEVFKRLGYNLYNILHTRYKAQLPEAVVIGGNVARAWDRFVPAMLAAMKENTSHFKLKQASLGEHAPLIGAAYLWA